MKKKFILFFSVIMFLISNNIFADTTIKLWINGSYISSDANPIIENNRTLVPIRVISENLGYEVEWNEETKSVGIAKSEDIPAIADGNLDKLLLLTIGENKVPRLMDKTLDTGELFYTLDVAPKIINGRTYVPLRFIAEYFNLKVDWDNENKTVIIGEGYIAPVKTTKNIEKKSEVVVINKNINQKFTADTTKGVIKGNKKSKIYHVPGGASYNRISTKNVVYFNTEQEAQAAGYRKAEK